MNDKSNSPIKNMKRKLKNINDSGMKFFEAYVQNYSKNSNSERSENEIISINKGIMHDLQEVNNDDTHYQETIYTEALTIYGFAKGINQGILHLEYKKFILNEWQKLINYINTKDYNYSHTSKKPSGAVLLAGNEIFKLMNL